MFVCGGVAGGGYRPFRAVEDSLHVFVDQYEPTSHHGVIKVQTIMCTYFVLSFI